MCYSLHTIKLHKAEAAEAEAGVQLLLGFSSSEKNMESVFHWFEELDIGWER